MKTDQNSTLVLVCKRPLQGQGKQRLAATLGTAVAQRIAEALLACALEDAEVWPGDVVVAPSTPEDAAWAAGLLARDCQIIPQSSGNLGQRLQQLDQHLRRQQHERILYIGSDAPILSPLHFKAAQQQLARTEVVLSAAEDGGVVLMGASRPWPPLADLPWSCDNLGDSLRQRCVSAGLSCGYIAPGYDIDVERDLYRLVRDLQQDSRPARADLYLLLGRLLPVVAEPSPRMTDAS
ncbi:TIGR04282 family arsenosugar biosynthesis glycosyltransferase [Motiliproteus sediminis]|uniref:TIGR04282 family arsenosugar biosynthesis glycosyltransferase n=1 Tax=Motiliproteus sediminis TaxID=1468178 RepID=UPI001AEF5ECC|nr:DUF2064 domain-containing protein [Motiliproteus sediminis]